MYGHGNKSIGPEELWLQCLAPFTNHKATAGEPKMTVTGASAGACRIGQKVKERRDAL